MPNRNLKPADKAERNLNHHDATTNAKSNANSKVALDAQKAERGQGSLQLDAGALLFRKDLSDP
jgi:hypothetical protein